MHNKWLKLNVPVKFTLKENVSIMTTCATCTSVFDRVYFFWNGSFSFLFPFAIAYAIHVVILAFIVGVDAYADILLFNHAYFFALL
jgi:hypothetical protein